VLRRKGRTFTDAEGACRSVIGCALAGGAGGLRPPDRGQPFGLAHRGSGRSASRFAQEFRPLWKGVDAMLECR
jgi:hypothetical protein